MLTIILALWNSFYRCLTFKPNSFVHQATLFWFTPSTISCSDHQNGTQPQQPFNSHGQQSLLNIPFIKYSPQSTSFTFHLRSPTYSFMALTTIRISGYDQSHPFQSLCSIHRRTTPHAISVSIQPLDPFNVKFSLDTFSTLTVLHKNSNSSSLPR